MNWTPIYDVAEWHLTYRCNLQCIGCNRLTVMPQHTPDMTVEDAEEFIKQARELGWKPEIILIGGEPTLHRDINRFIDLAYDFSQVPVRLFSNGYSERAKALLSRYQTDKRVHVVRHTLKPSGSIKQPLEDYYIAPCDVDGVGKREPCISHSAMPRKKRGLGCGISVDAMGYTVCPNGGAVDGALGLGLRTKRLADVFEVNFANKQTEELCRHCGCRWPEGMEKPDVEIIKDRPMSRTFADAMKDDKKQ